MVALHPYVDEMERLRAADRRFWSHVEYDHFCWRWTGWTDRNGYGHFYVAGGKMLAHRCAYALAAGVPATGFLDHLCRNPSCVNPLHLEVVSLRENTLRGVGPSARAAVATHCPAGHLFDEANTYTGWRGVRACRACGRAKALRYLQRKKAAAGARW